MFFNLNFKEKRGVLDNFLDFVKNITVIEAAIVFFVYAFTGIFDNKVPYISRNLISTGLILISYIARFYALKKIYNNEKCQLWINLSYSVAILNQFLLFCLFRQTMRELLFPGYLLIAIFLISIIVWFLLIYKIQKSNIKFKPCKKDEINILINFILISILLYVAFYFYLKTRAHTLWFIYG